jgi:hypothetical protein
VVQALLVVKALEAREIVEVHRVVIQDLLAVGPLHEDVEL